MQRQRVKLEIYVDLDPIPGTFHTVDSAVEQIERSLISVIPHYHPLVFPTDQVSLVQR